MGAIDLLCFTLLAKRGHSMEVKGVIRDAEFAANVVHLRTSLMLLDGFGDLFFALAFLHIEIS